MSATNLYRVDPAQNMSRFYRLDVQVDLFEAWCFIREWGRIGRAGQVRETAFASPEEAAARPAQLFHRARCHAHDQVTLERDADDGERRDGGGGKRCHRPPVDAL